MVRSSNLVNREGWKRVVFEKPLGYNLASARELNKCIYSIFKEEKVYRIDHYLAMELCHPYQFDMNAPEAYETLGYEIMLGDQTLFPRWDGVKASWNYVDPILRIIKNKKKEFPNYRAGSFGPEEAERLIKKDGREWCLPRSG